MRITNSNFYLITITALAALLILGLYYFSRQHNCCGECHVHGTQAIEQVAAEHPASEQPTETATENNAQQN